MGVTVTPDVGVLTATGFEPQINSGPMATPGTGQLVATGYAPQTAVDRQYLAYRLVIPGVGSTFAVGDPDPLADTDLYITSKRRVHHPWLAQTGEGHTATLDASIGGQKLDPALGHAVDGEVQLRVIDVPAPVSAVACDINSVLIPEGDSDLHLDSTAFTSGKWVKHSNTVATYAPEKDWGVNANGPQLGTFALFNWDDDGMGHSIGPWVRHTWIEATFDGTEGGVAWTPGQKVGFRFRVNWTLDTGGGNVFVELEGAEGPVRVSGLSPSFDFWSIPEDPLNNQVDLVAYATADASGEIIVRLGAENMYPSFNLVVQFTDMEVVTCDDVITGVDTERYVTGWLADSAARQQLLGRSAYLEESVDGGATWTRVLYAGFVKQITLDASLTYLFTLGDAGRGRRVSRAYTNLNPVEDFVP